MRVGIVVPHIFMHEAILPHVIFSPGSLALDLADSLVELGADVTLLTPGPIATRARSITADLSLFEQELAGRSDSYLDLLKKHPFTFVTLARQVQSEIIAQAFAMANNDELDIVHIYANEEDIALPFAKLCRKPVVFTHHDPFNFLVKYKNVFPKYKDLNWLSISLAQRSGMPGDTNWAGNIYHGVSSERFTPVTRPDNTYVAYFGRIIESKGTHLAIAAVKHHNQAHPEDRLTLKIAGKHYAGHAKDTYWHEKVEPLIDGHEIEYVGFIGKDAEKAAFLGNARGLIIPSLFDEPFGMVMIEALACGTPIIGLDSGAIPEVIERSGCGLVIQKAVNENETIQRLAAAIPQLSSYSRASCRQAFERDFTTGKMAEEHMRTYERLSRTNAS